MMISLDGIKIIKIYFLVNHNFFLIFQSRRNNKYYKLLVKELKIKK